MQASTPPLKRLGHLDKSTKVQRCHRRPDSRHRIAARVNDQSQLKIRLPTRSISEWKNFDRRSQIDNSLSLRGCVYNEQESRRSTALSRRALAIGKNAGIGDHSDDCSN